MMLDGRSSYSLNPNPYRIYSQKSALGADIFDCKDTREACEKVRSEIISKLESISQKVEQSDISAVNAIACALEIAKAVK